MEATISTLNREKVELASAVAELEAKHKMAESNAETMRKAAAGGSGKMLATQMRLEAQASDAQEELQGVRSEFENYLKSRYQVTIGRLQNLKLAASFSGWVAQRVQRGRNEQVIARLRASWSRQLFVASFQWWRDTAAESSRRVHVAEKVIAIVRNPRLRALPLLFTVWARAVTVLKHDRCGTPTTWTILQKDGPNHLGLWYNMIPEHQMSLITSPPCCRADLKQLTAQAERAAVEAKHLQLQAAHVAMKIANEERWMGSDEDQQQHQDPQPSADQLARRKERNARVADQFRGRVEQSAVRDAWSLWVRSAQTSLHVHARLASEQELAELCKEMEALRAHAALLAGLATDDGGGGGGGGANLPVELDREERLDRLLTKADRKLGHLCARAALGRWRRLVREWRYKRQAENNLTTARDTIESLVAQNDQQRKTVEAAVRAVTITERVEQQQPPYIPQGQGYGADEYSPAQAAGPDDNHGPAAGWTGPGSTPTDAQHEELLAENDALRYELRTVSSVSSIRGDPQHGRPGAGGGGADPMARRSRSDWSPREGGWSAPQQGARGQARGQARVGIRDGRTMSLVLGSDSLPMDTPIAQARNRLGPSRWGEQAVCTAVATAVCTALSAQPMDLS